MFLRTELNAYQIRAAIASPDKVRDSAIFERANLNGSPLRSEDSIMVLEIGENFSAHGFTDILTWLERH
jgi:hypothetical protein